MFFYGFVPHKLVGNYINCNGYLFIAKSKKLILDGVGDISCFTSPLKLFEYMSHKKTIVASNIEVLKEVLNEQNSILVDPENINEWIKSLDKLKDPPIEKKFPIKL